MKALSAAFWFLMLCVVIAVAAVGALRRALIPETPQVVDTCPESMVCYEPYGAPVEPQFILDGTIIKIVFIAAEDMPDDIEANAMYSVDFDANISWCVITTTMPQQVLGDPLMDALGHEVLHCLTGDYHP